MKLRFNNFDVQCAVNELQCLIGSRVNQIYDVDNKTLLFRLHGGESKSTLLLESGIRFHTTSFEWTKNNTPSGFTMKLRKHLKNKRLEKLEQLGTDRIVNFVFGTNEVACNLILELYDRGNIILTDYENVILYILRPHTEGEDLRLAVREKYPDNRANEKKFILSESDLKKELAENKSDNIKGFLMRILDCGSAVVDHALKRIGVENCFLKEEFIQKSSKKYKSSLKQKGLSDEKVLKVFNQEEDLPNLMKVIKEINRICNEAPTDDHGGYIIQKREEKTSTELGTIDYFYHNIEYHPYLFDQHKDLPYKKYSSFVVAVDEFYSSLEAQKIDLKTLQIEKEALKKLSNVKLDHEKRLDNLAKAQEIDKLKADLITTNLSLVDSAINAIRQLVANQMPWTSINLAVKTAQEKGDPIATLIHRLKLESNIISLNLVPKYDYSCDESINSSETSNKPESTVVDIDISYSAWANARKYYDHKRFAAQKEQKTIDASGKALKNAERKTQQTLKDVRTISTIAKARKTFWFEKFYWFISSENFLVIGGRDAQQNELIVKRYMRSSDIYVHAEIQGASSVVIRNPSGGEVPPKTLLEAGTMAISYSVAWDAKVLTNAYWVYSDQVSKTAPSGEYLGTGSFMIRGKKNFLPPCQLIMGISVLFKLEESFISKHNGERKMKVNDEDSEDVNFELKPVSTSFSADKIVADSTDPNSQNLETNNGIDFPDTEIKIAHDTGRITLSNQIADESSNIKSDNDIIVEKVNIEEATLINAMPSKRKTQVSKKKAAKDNKKKNNIFVNEIKEEAKIDSQMKRGKRNKERRKNKYKDQDKEERDLRMQILKSSGNYNPENEKLLSKDEEKSTGLVRAKLASNKQLNDKVDMDLDDIKLSADVDMLHALTGQPFDDDEILFALPVIAPYQALQAYKYKVKIIPGTGKRGSAAKNTLALFTKEKTCTPREKDLFKSIKDEVIARNIPGKVKLMASQLQKLKS